MTTHLATYQFTEEQRENFRSGKLRDQWLARYPKIFDEGDLRIAANQPDYHFFEWLAAVLIYNTFGYLSLVEQYEFSNHARKQELLRALVSPELLSLIGDHSVQCPDLFAYKPDSHQWFFCEVKGPSDTLRPEQEEYFSRLASVAERPVRLIEFQETSL